MSYKDKFSIGDEVWCHAYQTISSIRLDFLCKAIIVRLPTPISKVYKVAVIAVLMDSNKPKDLQKRYAKELVGMMVPKYESDIITFETDMMRKLHNLEDEWLWLDMQSLYKLKKKILRKDKN